MNSEARLKTWNVYQSAWGPIDEAERRRLLKLSIADDIVYTDPSSQTRDFDELVARIDKSQAQFPGARCQVRE